MSWEETVHLGLRANGIKLVCYVPDIVLSGLIKRLEADPEFQVVSVTREEEGVGILTGGYLVGARGALLLQSSGLGNSVLALASLAVPQQIPFLMVVSTRGDVGDFNPFQVPMGRVLERLLDLLSIQHVSPKREDEVQALLDRACGSAFKGNLPVAMLLTRELTGGKVG